MIAVGDGGAYFTDAVRHRFVADSGLPPHGRDKSIRTGSRALAILIVLVEHAGKIVSKEEVFQKVWPGTIV